MKNLNFVTILLILIPNFFSPVTSLAAIAIAYNPYNPWENTTPVPQLFRNKTITVQEKEWRCIGEKCATATAEAEKKGYGPQVGGSAAGYKSVLSIPISPCLSENKPRHTPHHKKHNWDSYTYWLDKKASNVHYYITVLFQAIKHEPIIFRRAIRDSTNRNYGTCRMDAYDIDSSPSVLLDEGVWYVYANNFRYKSGNGWILDYIEYYLRDFLSSLCYTATKMYFIWGESKESVEKYLQDMAERSKIMVNHKKVAKIMLHVFNYNNDFCYGLRYLWFDIEFIDSMERMTRELMYNKFKAPLDLDRP